MFFHNNYILVAFRTWLQNVRGNVAGKECFVRNEMNAKKVWGELNFTLTKKRLPARVFVVEEQENVGK